MDTTSQLQFLQYPFLFDGFLFLKKKNNTKEMNLYQCYNIALEHHGTLLRLLCDEISIDLLA